MKVAVLTLTRDRLEYTKHCFGLLEEIGGCPFDHFVLDQGSQDGTQDWLSTEYLPKKLVLLPTNVGIMDGLNILLSEVGKEYDVIVKFDNDCEIVTGDCLHDVAQATLDLNALLSPTIRGLRYPPVPTHSSTIGRWKVNHVPGNIGGIFLSAPGNFYDGWNDRATDMPKWGMDDVLTCNVAKDRGMMVGYLDGYAANHYETTDGQHARFPWYFDRRIGEGGPP